ncbi:hypothetical protein Tco_0580363, partial [Tanacetum coccineum]
IPRDLYPRLPLEEFVMSELPDDAIGIYHRMFDFSGVRIPFSSFILALIKHYRVQFSQLGPLGLNKVITFEVLYRSLQIEPTVTLFRVFQTLCKQSDWFSFAKRHAPSPRHSDIAIDDPRPASSSFSMADVRRLSAYVIKLRDMSEGVLPFYCTSPAAVDVVIPNPTLEDLVVGTLSSNILAKDEASQKRKASTSSTTLSHVAKCTRSALAQSSGITIRPSLFVGDSDDESDGDDDACVEIPLVTPLRSAAVISSLRNQGRSSTAPAAEGPNTRVSTLKKQVFGLNDKLASSDASFAKSKAKGKERKKKIKSLTKSLDNLYAEVARLSVALNQATVLEAKKDEEILRLKMTPLEFSSFFRGQFQDWVRKFLASDEFSRVQAELLSLAASAGFKPGLSMHQTKDEFTTVLKKMSNFMPGAQDRLAEDSPLLLELIMPFLTRFLSMLLNLYWLSFSLSLKNCSFWPTSPFKGCSYFSLTPPPPPSRDDRVTTKESTVTPTSNSLELSANINLTASVVASEHNEEMVNAEVDGSEPKMTDDTVAAKFVHVFVPGISVALEDDVELVEVGSGRASSGLNDVVVSLSVGEKGDGLVPSSATGEKAAPNSSRV